MAMKYDTRSCTISQNWEWVQVAGSGASKTVTKTGVSISILQQFAWDGGDWQTVGSAYASTSSQTYSYSDSDGYSGDIPLQSFSGTVPPPTYSGTTVDQRVTLSGGATATYSGTVTKTSSTQWGASGNSTHNASNSISYDDGTYAGTLYLDSVSGSPSPPSYNGSSIGETASTSTSGTAYYSGDVPLKATAPSSPTNFRVTSQNSTSVNLAWDSSSGATSYAVETYLQGTGTLINSNYGITATTKFITGLTSGQSYTFKLWAVNSAGNSSPVFTSATIGSPRPSNWSWTTLSPSANTYTSGKLRVNLVSSGDWNNFTQRINEFRQYKNLATVSFLAATSSYDFTQAMYDQAVSAISAMTTVNQTGGFYTKLINLKDALNSIT